MTISIVLFPTDIDAIPAGRELDALIAEKVTGWKARHFKDKCNGEYFIRCGACGAYGHGNCYGHGAGAMQIKCGEHRACCDEAELPAYSTDIAAAWEVVEKLRNSFGELVLNFDGDWRCFFGVHLSLSLTAPLAICRAALKAVLTP